MLAGCDEGTVPTDGHAPKWWLRRLRLRLDVKRSLRAATRLLAVFPENRACSPWSNRLGLHVLFDH
jgi:hypothetical protein